LQNNSIYIFFLALCLLFWNPLTYQWIYAGTPVTQTPHMLVIFGVLFMLGLLIIWGLRRNFFGPKGKNRIFSLSFLGILFALLVGVDGLVGMMRAKAHNGIIFQPDTEVKYQTVEFDIVAKTNNLGLRDHNIDVDKKDHYRILCFGDSWTYGWGVNIDDSWPKVLERHLQAKGISNVEVINCGQGGQYPTVYLKYMEKAIPMLKPDLVLVGVLQGDDLAQLYEQTAFANEGNNESSSVQRFVKSVKFFIKSSFINILSGQRNIHAPTVDIRKNWKNSTNRLINGMDPVQVIRFQSLSDTLQFKFIFRRRKSSQPQRSLKVSGTPDDFQ
jgi:hypothetical protein